MVFGTYVKLEEFRKIVDIDDTIDDPELQLIIDTANQDVDTWLFPFADELPLTGDLAIQATNAANYRAASLWKAKKHNEPLAKYYNENFANIIKLVIERLKATPTTRTKRVGVQTDYKTRLLFSQTKRF